MSIIFGILFWIVSMVIAFIVAMVITGLFSSFFISHAAYDLWIIIILLIVGALMITEYCCIPNHKPIYPSKVIFTPIK